MKTQTSYYVEPVFQNIPGVNSEKLDFNKSLKNKKDGGGVKRYVLDVYQITGEKPDQVFRSINGGNIGDLYKKYENINLLGNGEMTAYITKISNIGELPILVKKGDIVEIKGRILSENGTINLKIENGGAYRLLYGDALSLTKTNTAVIIIITKDGTLNAKYGDHENNMIISLFITIS